MHIVHITTEINPIAKVGGLGDMLQGLTQALALEGHRIEVILPFYGSIHRKNLPSLQLEKETFTSYQEMSPCTNKVHFTFLNKLKILLIEPIGGKNYFNQKPIYGMENDIERFTYFCRASLEYLLKRGLPIDVLHLHDWLTGLCAPLYREIFKNEGLNIRKIVTTIHNIKYQGICTPNRLSHIGFFPKSLMTTNKFQDHKKFDHINILKSALIYSDALTTVSPSYAKEIQGEKGFGLGPILIENQPKLRGILNGIDTNYWNPQTDPLIPFPYSFPSSIESIIATKKKNQKTLLKSLNIPYDEAPLFIVITRLVKQKGPQLIEEGIKYILKKGGKVVLLGSFHELEVKKQFQNCKDRYENNPNVHFHFTFNEPLSHLTFASADFILIPSLFEPCGLTQMIALRYGTLPIVHKVGGLKDTIFDVDDIHAPSHKKNGYIFDFPSSESLCSTIERAFHHFLMHDQKKRKTLLENGLQSDWSWKIPALTYLKVYHGT